MKYILEFENWVSAIKEGFDAKIEDDKDTKDEIEIEAPNEDNTIKYIVDKDDNVKSKKIISTDNGDQEEEENIVNDKQLEDDIIDAVDKINDIKDRVEAEELRRLTGGDRSTDSETVKQIKKIFKNKNNIGSPIYICNCKGFMEFLTSSENWFHLNISDITGKYNIDTENVYYKFKPKKGVGKGEYLLPLLFDDVYKQKIHGENTKGDNFIVHSEDNVSHTYYLELKAPNASLGFKKKIRDYIEKEILKDNIEKEEKEEIYKNAIVASIMEYAKRLKGSSWENLYMCIFGETNSGYKSPDDILFINVSEIEENDIKPNIDADRTSLFKEIFDMIKIDNMNDYNISKRKGKIKKDIAYSFSFTYKHDENPKINCKLKSETIQDIHNESYEQ